MSDQRQKKWWQAPHFEGDWLRTHRASLLNFSIIVVMGMTVLSSLLLLFLKPQEMELTVTVGVILLLLFLGCWWLLQEGWVSLAAWMFSVVLWMGITVLLFVVGGVRSHIGAGYFVVLVVAGAVLGERGVVTFGALGVFSVVVAFLAEAMGWMATGYLPVAPAVETFTLVVALVLTATLLRVLLREGVAEFRRMWRSEEAAVVRYQETERERVALASRVRLVERQLALLMAGVPVVQTAFSTLELRSLLGQVVEMVGEQFGFEYVGLYVLDSTRRWVELRAATTSAGKRRVEEGVRFEVVGGGVVGSVVEYGNLYVSDAATDRTAEKGVLLPDMASLMLLPLRVRGEIVGVLEVQGRAPGAFRREDAEVLQVLADYVGLAMVNARRFQELRRALEDARRASGQARQEMWQELLRTRAAVGYVSTAQGTFPLEGRRYYGGREGMIPALEGASLAELGATSYLLSRDRLTLFVPIRPRDEVLGVVRLRKPAERGGWTHREIALMEILTSQLGVALESAHLYEVSQQQATEEQLLSAVTASIRQSLEMDVVLRTAVTEMRKALQLAEVELRIGVGHSSSEER